MNTDRTTSSRLKAGNFSRVELTLLGALESRLGRVVPGSEMSGLAAREQAAARRPGL